MNIPWANSFNILLPYQNMSENRHVVTLFFTHKRIFTNLVNKTLLDNREGIANVWNSVTSVILLYFRNFCHLQLPGVQVQLLKNFDRKSHLEYKMDNAEHTKDDVYYTGHTTVDESQATDCRWRRENDRW